MHRILAEAAEPFYHEGKPQVSLILLFLLINGLILLNAVLHDPTKGYDAGDHIQYIKTLAEDRRIPTCADSAQCYIPPLPYMLPAILLATGRFTLLEAAKVAQLANVLISGALGYLLLKIAALVTPDSVGYRFSALAMLGILPVYYKTFSLIRGEVYLPLLVVLSAFLLLTILVDREVRAPNLLLLGISVGLAILARQWGFLILPAIFLCLAYMCVKDHSRLTTAIYAGAACVVLPLLVAGWYYAIMYQRYGTLTAWDRPASKLSLGSLPIEFYIGLGSGKLFTDPIRPSFSNQFPAIFYSDTWGDYSGYFLVYLRNKENGEYQTGKDLERLIVSGKPLPADLETNRFTINSYLGRVNLVSLFPSLIFLAGIIYAGIRVWRSFAQPALTTHDFGSLVFLLIIVFSMTGYGWYLLRYQNQGRGGDLIKATHMMQVFPFLGLMAGQVLEKLRERSSKMWLGAMALLALIFVHNLPAMVTHYAIFP